MPLRADILTEHAEEIEILWSRRRAALWSPRETLDTLAALERRIDAHVDGLALDAEGAHESFARGLAGDDADAAFTSAVTLLRQRTMSTVERLFVALAAARPAARAGIGEALAYEPLAPAAEQRLEDLLTGDADPALEAVARRALAAHGRRPAARELTLGEARAACADARRADGAALFALGCLGEAADVPALVRAAAGPATMEPALRALGSLGIDEAVEALFGFMPDDGTGPPAGEAFRRITGIEVVPRADAPSPEADDSFEETRPWPDAARTRALWAARGAPGSGPGRWRHGAPVDAHQWLADPHAGDLLTRREEITRLRAGQPGALAQLDLDAPASRQRNWSP